MSEVSRNVTAGIGSEAEVADLLKRLNWKQPGVAAEQADELLAAFTWRVEEDGDPRAAALYHAALDWLDDAQDPRSGLWGDRKDLDAALTAAGKLCARYERVHRPMRALVNLANEALARFPLAGKETAPHIERLLRFVQATAAYRTNDIDNLLGARAVTGRSIRSEPLNPLWMREPVGGSRRFAQAADVGVVVTCYNLGEYLFETLNSIAAQTLAECELVIVNDGSTCRFTNAYLEFLVATGYQVLNQPNAGLAKARNAGIQLLSSQYVCCFDADDLMHPEWLERAQDVLKSRTDVGYVSCYYTTFDNDYSVYRYDHARYPEMLVENQTVGVSVFRRECWDRAGGYCADFRAGMEDWDFWLSILDLGYAGTCIPEVLFYYRTRIGSMYTRTRETDTYMDNINLLLTRHRTSFEAHWPDVVRLRAQHFVELLNVRSAEADAQRDQAAHQRTTIAHQRTTIANLEANRSFLQGQVASSEHAATEALARAGRLEHEMHELRRSLEDTIARLERDKHELSLEVRAALVALEAKLERPGIFVAAARTVLLVASHPFSGAKWKNIGLALDLLRNTKARAIWNRNFDAAWYTRRYTDIARSGISPLVHYLFYGHAEGRSPSRDFDSEFYLRRHPDVRTAGLNPLLHYALFGVQENRTSVAAVAPPPPTSASSEAPGTSGGPRFCSRRIPSRVQSDMPLVTVVIPCFNYGDYLAEALRSIQRQTLPNVEVIVVEGGSTDGVTPDTVRRLEQSGETGAHFLYRSEPHLTGDNRNFGIQHARGEYVCCLDADDGLKPNYLEVAAFLAETYGYDLVYSSVQAFERDDFTWALKDADPNTIIDYNQVSTVAVFRRTAWHEVNGYRDFGRGSEYVAEDWELWVRMLRSGFRAKCIPEPLHLYRVHTAGLWHGGRSSVDYQRQKIIEANGQSLANQVVLRPFTPNPDTWGTLLQPSPDTGALLLALPFVIIGGAEKIFEALIRSETARGREVVVITTLTLPDTVKDNAEHFQSLTPYFYALPKLFDQDTRVWDDFVSYLIDQYSVDLIMIAGCDYMYHALPDLTAAFPQVGIVDQLFNDEVHFPTNRHYARHIDVTMVPSPVFAHRITKEFQENPDKVAVIPHGVDIPPLPDPETRMDMRRQSRIPSEWMECFIAGFFGRMSPEKAPADFIEIARALKSEPGMRFVMTGEGPEFERVRSLIRRHGLEDRVLMLGFVDDPRALMMAVDAVVVPSRLDGMPLVVMESQALGKAVIASAVGSIPVMIQDDRTGMLCAAGDIPGFVGKLRHLQRSPAVREQIGRDARQWAEANHSASAMIRRYEAAFEAARSKHPERSVKSMCMG